MKTFNPTTFKTDYPLFSSLSDGFLTNTFNFNVLVSGRVIYGLFVDGSDEQYYWACQVLAHVLVLSNGQSGQQNGIGKVGIITQVSEGDVSGSFNVPASADSFYWQQTSYGTACYNLLMQRGGATYFAQDSYNGYVGYGNGYNSWWN